MVDPRLAAAAEIAAKLGHPNGADRTAPLRVIAPPIFQAAPVPVRQWIVPDWVPRGYVSGLFGPGGTGKSLVAMQLMTALSLGRPWFGLSVEPRRSIGIFCEDDTDELQRRQHDINREVYDRDFADLDNMLWLPRLGEDNLLMTFTRDGRGETTPFYAQILDLARDERAEFIVVDTLADVFGGNQNDAGQVRQFVQRALGSLARTVGGVLVCAHPSRAGQNNGSGESGSVQWDAAFRSRLYLCDPKKDDDDPGDPNARVLSRKKSNYAAREDVIELLWNKGAFHGGSEPEGNGVEQDAETVFLALLDKMKAENRPVSDNSHASNYAPRIFKQRPERGKHRQKNFEKAMHSLFSMGEITMEEYGKPSSGRRRIARRGAGLPF